LMQCKRVEWSIHWSCQRLIAKSSQHHTPLFLITDSLKKKHQSIPGWWFQTCLFSIIYGIILPINIH
jgi:hypothetical protein